eukprot:GEMP01009416.1.p1 GENE.GEMP01009416.1~~GEMP01009416.1.p1  ORF type:complete len:950 (+),score=212.90 GEMP01009416.1:25-2850(+)
MALVPRMVSFRRFTSWASTLQSATVDTEMCFSPSRPLPALARSLLLLPPDVVHWATAARAFARRTPEATTSEAFSQTVANQLLVLRAFLHWRGPPVPAVEETTRKLCIFLANNKNIPNELKKLSLEAVEALHAAPLQQIQRLVGNELLRRYKVDKTYLSPVLYNLRHRLSDLDKDELDQAILYLADKGDKETMALCAKYTLRYLDHRPLQPLGSLRPKLWDAPNVLTSWTEYARTPDSADAEFVFRLGLRQSTPLELVRCAAQAPANWAVTDITKALLAAWPQVSGELMRFPVDDLPHVIRHYLDVAECSPRLLEVLSARMEEMRFATLLECLIPIEGPQPEFDAHLQRFFETVPSCMDVAELELDLSLERRFALIVAFADRGFMNDHWLISRVLSCVESTLQESDSSFVPDFHPSTILRACHHLPIFADHPRLTSHILDTMSTKRWTPEETSSADLTYALTALGTCRKQCPRPILVEAVTGLLEQAKNDERAMSPRDWERICSIPFLDYATKVMPKLFPMLVHADEFSPEGVCTLLERLRDWANSGGNTEYWSSEQNNYALAPILGVQRALDVGLDKNKWSFPQLELIFNSLAKLGWCEPHTVERLCSSAMRIEDETRVPITAMLSIVESLTKMQVFHGPLLERFVKWYAWHVSAVRQNELTSDELDSMARWARNLAKLNFKSLAFAKVVATQLPDGMPATPVQKLRLLTQLARFGYFPPEFRQGLISVVEASKASPATLDDDVFADLSKQEWAEAYYLHLCTYFDGPERLRMWITHDANIIHFIKGDPAHYWFEEKRAEGRRFKTLRAARSLKESLASLLGENVLVPGHDDENFIYYVNFIDPGEPTTSYKPLAVVVVPPRNEFKVCVPLIGPQPDREMFDGMVCKIRHLRSLRYRVVVIYDNEWERMNRTQHTAYLARLLRNAGEDVKDPVPKTAAAT